MSCFKNNAIQCVNMADNTRLLSTVNINTLTGTTCDYFNNDYCYSYELKPEFHSYEIEAISHCS